MCVKFSNNGIWIKDVADLPNLQNANKLFLDFETTSGDRRIASVNPWKNCGILGIAITVDELPNAFYVPASLGKQPVYKWLADVMKTSKTWVNHNIKYDVHVAYNCAGIAYTGELWDTLTGAKLINSDRFRYSLDVLSKEWLHEDISKYEARFKPFLKSNKDYGNIPTDIMAEYACQDVLTGRRLYKFINSRIPEQCKTVWQVERELTSLLVKIERKGLKVDRQELQATEYRLLTEMLEIENELQRRVGFAIRPHVNEDCGELLVGHFGLPVLAYTDTGNPSFDKHALALYAMHPNAPRDIVELLISHRHKNTLINFFVRPYQELCDDNGLLHSSYNQCVRTGRMSCSTPNSQQLSPDAKELIHPRMADNSFISSDASQIEFRTICNYINDTSAIEAFNKDPDTDFHQWVADMAGMKRKPAKNLNFMMAYGGGKKKAIAMLGDNIDVVGPIKEYCDNLVADGVLTKQQADKQFSSMCRDKALSVYGQYHATLPTLKETAERAANSLRYRGYVFNLMGRHRHLPFKLAHIAFNTINQSLASDIVKERMVALDKLITASGLENDLYLVGQVHDEVLLESSTEIAQDESILNGIIACLEHQYCELKLPLRWEIGTSNRHWRGAGETHSKRKRAPGTPVCLIRSTRIGQKSTQTGSPDTLDLPKN